MTITRFQIAAVGVIASAALLLGACGSDDKKDATTGTTVEAADGTTSTTAKKAETTTSTAAKATTTTSEASSSTTSTTTAGPPCTEAAIAPLFSGTAVIQNIVCDGGYAGVAVSDDNVTQGWVLTASSGSWAIISPSPCGTASAGIPPAVLDAGCFVD